MVTFTINIPQMLAYIPYMDPVGSIPSIPLRQRGGPWPQLQFLLSAAGSLSGARPGRGISRLRGLPGGGHRAQRHGERLQCLALRHAEWLGG